MDAVVARTIQVRLVRSDLTGQTEEEKAGRAPASGENHVLRLHGPVRETILPLRGLPVMAVPVMAWIGKRIQKIEEEWS